MKIIQKNVIFVFLILSGLCNFSFLSIGKIDFASDNQRFPKNSDVGVDILGWNVNVLDAEEVWGIQDGFDWDVIPGKPAGQGVNVLIIDTGIKNGHEDLAGNYVDGYDYWDWGLSFPDDDDGHGTKCAGIIAMEDNGKGALGVAPKANLYVARVGATRDFLYVPYVQRAIEDAEFTWYDDDPTNNIHIISMSFAGDNSLGAALHEEIFKAYEAGIVMVASVGNNGVAEIKCPASNPYVLAVGAVEKEIINNLWSGNVVRSNFSNYGDGEYMYLTLLTGSHLDVVAPGKDIYTTNKNSINDYVYDFGGTSAAASHVAGVAALIISQDLQNNKRDLSVADIYTILRNTATTDLIADYGDYSEEEAYDRFGYGLINAYGACDLENPAVSIISPSSEIWTTSGNIKCKAIASDNYRVRKVQFKIDSGSWNDATYVESNDIWKWNWLAGKSGVYTLHCRAYDARGNYQDTSKVVTVRMGIGCPILSVFDGEKYVEEGLLDIHNSDGIDVIYSHTLNTPPGLINNRYILRLTEHHKTMSHIDKVELWGQLSNGRMMKLHLLSAIHNELGQVKNLLWFSDERKIDMLGADHNNGASQFIDLEFTALKGLTFNKFVFIIEGNNPIIK
ncbi:MAG: S8 family serine peptidase [Candidatus Odinarchaeota archaeon]